MNILYSQSNIQRRINKERENHFLYRKRFSEGTSWNDINERGNGFNSLELDRFRNPNTLQAAHIEPSDREQCRHPYPRISINQSGVHFSNWRVGPHAKLVVYTWNLIIGDYDCFRNVMVFGFRNTEKYSSRGIFFSCRTIDFSGKAFKFSWELYFFLQSFYIHRVKWINTY